MHRDTRVGFAVCVLLVSLFLLAGSAASQQVTDMGGWDKDSPYNQLYDPRERDKFKGIVEAVREEVPMEGMAPAVVLVVKDQDDQEVVVHLGPRWFVDPKTLGFRVGDKVKVYGVWAELNDEDIFMASKIKKGETYEYKVRRTKDGTPWWTMTPEELAAERAGQ